MAQTEIKRLEDDLKLAETVRAERLAERERKGEHMKIIKDLQSQVKNSSSSSSSSSSSISSSNSSSSSCRHLLLENGSSSSVAH